MPLLRRWLTEEELFQVPTPFDDLVGWRLERIDYGEVKLTGSTCLPDQCSVDESLDELKSQKFSQPECCRFRQNVEQCNLTI